MCIHCFTELADQLGISVVKTFIYLNRRIHIVNRFLHQPDLFIALYSFEQTLCDLLTRFLCTLLGKRLNQIVRPQACPTDNQQECTGCGEQQADGQRGTSGQQVQDNRNQQQCAADDLKTKCGCAVTAVIASGFQRVHVGLPSCMRGQARAYI